MQDQQNSKDIELPLLGKRRSHQSLASPQKKSHFTEFLRTDSPSAQYQTNIPTSHLLTFWDTYSFTRKVNAKTTPLELKDLPLVFHFFNVEKKIVEMDKLLSERGTAQNLSLAKALALVYKTELIALGFLAFFFIVLSIVPKMMYGSLISILTLENFGQGTDVSAMVWLAIALSIFMLATVFLDNWFWHFGVMNGMRIRQTLIGVIYKKLQSIALNSLQALNVGKVINLISNDVNDFDRMISLIFPTILTPFTCLIALVIIWSYFGPISIISIVGIFGFFFTSIYLSNLTKEPRKKKNQITDQRIKFTNEIIECIRLLKMYAWEKAFRKVIELIRVDEVEKVLQIKILESIGESLALESPNICIYLMALVYTLQGNILSPTQVFPTLMILNFVRVWGIYFFHSGRMLLVSVRVTLQRIEDVLAIKDVLSIQDSQLKLKLNPERDEYELEELISPRAVKTPVCFRNFSAWWNPESAPTLQDINLTIAPGQITAVIGRIGSGKTSFLHSFLKEMPKTTGELTINGTIAYVEQEPIIFSGSVRYNILFGRELDKKKYETILEACALVDDLKKYTDGDATLIGERGVTLSGGQKTRISLARALYSNSDIYVLDDPLSAVDSKVGRHIFENAIRGILMKDKIIILVTHNLPFAKECDKVIIFEEGRVKAEGSPESLQSLISAFNSEFSNSAATQMIEDPEKLNPETTSKEDKKAAQDDEKINVIFDTYIRYLKQNGQLVPFFILLSMCVGCSLLSIIFMRLVGSWSLENEKWNLGYGDPSNRYDNSYYILWAGLTALALPILETFKSIMFQKIILDTNSNIHKQMLYRLTRATVLFFDLTPIGTILNRFSNDLGASDQQNPGLYSNVVDGFIQIATMVIYLAIINPMILVPSLFFIGFLFKLKSSFAKSVLEAKRLDLATRSPLYSNVSATINGLVIIRNFGQGGLFLRKFCDLLYQNLRGFLFMERTQRLFAFSMNLTLCLMTVIGTFVFIYIASNADLDAGLFGVALNLLLEISGYGSWVVRMTLNLDVNMQSAERMLRYTNLPSEAKEEMPHHDAEVLKEGKGIWPLHGNIRFEKVYMKYRDDLNYALNDVNFFIPSGTKVGVVGRTGAGKSSIIQAIFRLVEIESMPGCSIKIDDVDIKRIGLELLRKNISIIPQTAVIFTGSIKRNLDPFDNHSEDEIWKVLKEVGLKKKIKNLEDKLNTDLTVSNSVFSAGEKQLICLARVLLKKNKIILLDEATANVDQETDDFIQQTIKKKFQECTVITIAHRLATIANYDKIMVLDQGKIVEFNTPYRLLIENEGDKKITNENGYFAKMVLKLGEYHSNKIFNTAYTRFLHE